MKLEYLSYSVTLKGPSYNDVVRHETQKQVHQSRHGEPIIIRDSNWPVIKTHQFESVCNERDTMTDLKELISASAGMEITLTLEDNTLTGFIVTSENEIITVRDDCHYDVGFQFMESQA